MGYLEDISRITTGNPYSTSADLGEKITALGSGMAEGAVDTATLPMRLGSWGLDEAGFLPPGYGSRNIETLNNASYAAADYLDERKAMLANPEISDFGNAMAPIVTGAGIGRAIRPLYNAASKIPANPNLYLKGPKAIVPKSPANPEELARHNAYQKLSDDRYISEYRKIKMLDKVRHKERAIKRDKLGNPPHTPGDYPFLD